MIPTRLWKWAAGGLLAVALPASAGPGYLARLGPARLRFQPPPPEAPVGAEAAVIRTNLSAVATPVSPPVGSAEQVQASPAAGPPPPTPAPQGPVPVSSLAPPVATHAPLPATELLQPAALPIREVLSPQLLIPYFTGPQGGVNPTLVTPVPFIPPQAPGRAVSKATYTVTP